MMLNKTTPSELFQITYSPSIEDCVDAYLRERDKRHRIAAGEIYFAAEQLFYERNYLFDNIRKKPSLALIRKKTSFIGQSFNGIIRNER
ncbi:MAG: hypothetical protein E6Q97_25180 [Desulfurellales bacterium]|nr:MAG: hypothetical protein E6Q97_25180 [Desulfurellales bacterium]